MSTSTPIVIKVQVIPATGYNNMEVTLSGAHAPYFTWDLVIVKDNSDRIGIGKIHGGDCTYEYLTSCIPLIMGQEAGRCRSILGCTHRDDKQATGDDGGGIQTLDISKLKFVVKAEWAIEYTLLSLLGQHLGIPMYESPAERKQQSQMKVLSYLFYVSGKNKTDLPHLNGSQSRGPWFRMRCQKMISHEQIVGQTCCLRDRYGYRGFRFKGGVFSGDYETDTVRTLKRQFSQGRINIDPNDAWGLEEAIRLCRGMDSILSYIEDPRGPEAGFFNREVMVELKDATGLLIATSMIAANQRQFYHAAALKIVNVVLASPYFQGLEGSLRMAAFLDDWGFT